MTLKRINAPRRVLLKPIQVAQWNWSMLETFLLSGAASTASRSNNLNRISILSQVSDVFDVVEKSIAQLRAALQSGETTAVELVQTYQGRIARYDRPDSARRDGRAADGGVPLNSVVVDNPQAL